MNTDLISFVTESLPSLTWALVIGIAVFLATRGIMLWYWKVNRIETLLTEIRDRLPRISTESDDR